MKRIFFVIIAPFIVSALVMGAAVIALDFKHNDELFKWLLNTLTIAGAVTLILFVYHVFKK